MLQCKSPEDKNLSACLVYLGVHKEHRVEDQGRQNHTEAQFAKVPFAHDNIKNRSQNGEKEYSI